MKSLQDLGNNTDRVEEIVSVLVKYGLAEWLKDSKIEWIRKKLKEGLGKDILNKSRNERVRMALTELGTTFIKFGQVLSTRSDIIGSDLADELTQLQSTAPNDGIAVVRKRIIRELGIKSLEEVFSEFSTEPIASASIAQVHKAVLISGEEVAVKVIRDGVKETVQEDLKILSKLAKFAQTYGGRIKAYQPIQLIRNFSQIMLGELDFRKELSNLQMFTENFSDDSRVEFPKAFDEFSSQEVLVMSFMTGQPLQKVQDLDWSPEQKNYFTEESADVFMEMMFRDHFYHADPHPGNLLVMENGSLGVLDCGMVARLDTKTNALFEELIVGVAQKDGEHIKNVILNMGILPKGVDYGLLTSQIDEIITKYIDLPLNDFDMSAAINDFTAIIHEHHIILPTNASGLFRVVGLLEGSSRLLNPNFNIAILFKRYHYKIIRRRYSPKSLLNKAIKNIREWENVLELTPKALGKLLRLMGSDQFEVNLEHRNLENSVNRLVMGLITAAVFLGSSILVSFSVPPVYQGYSILGFIGLMVSIYLAVKVYNEIRQSKE